MPLEYVPENDDVEVVYVDEESAESLASKLSSPDPFENEKIDKLGGLDGSTKRRASRQLKKYLQGKDAGSKQQQPEAISGYKFFEVAEPPHNLEYLAKLYEISAPHFAAINAKVSNIVGLGYDFKESEKTREVLQESSDDEERLERQRRKVARAKARIKRELEDLNEEDTFVEILSKVWTDVEATGNGYLEIGRKQNGELGYIGHIPSHTMRVRLARDGFVQISSNGGFRNSKVVFFHNLGYSYTEEADGNIIWHGSPITDDPRPNEVIHFKKYSPSDSYYGIPDILAATNAVAGNEFASRFNLDYFEHKAVPRNLIVVKGAKLSKDSEQRLIEFFQTGLKGKHHRSVYIPLPAGDKDNPVDFKIEQIEGNIQDASFIRYYTKNRDEILMAHRVPLTKVGMAEGVSLAVARDADKMFKEQVCRPAQDKIEKKLRKLFEREFGRGLKFKLNELTLTDEDTMSKIWERLLRMQVVTPNEVREEMGWKGREGGDEVVPTFQEKDQTAGQRDQRAQARGSRTRDSQRSANAPDNDGEARQPQGEGRSTA